MNLQETISNIFGNKVSIVKRTPVSGGDINRAYALTISDGSRLFMKSNLRENADFFRAEGEGLDAIRATGTISVPKVIATGEDARESFLLLEYIEDGHRSRASSEEFGRQLGEMHLAEPAFRKYGFPTNNYIGAGVQINTPSDSWKDFFINMRLRPQFDRAASWWNRADRKNIDLFLGRVDRYLDEPAHPSLIHGDLWAGNYMIDSAGKPWLIDPAAYFGHAEADIAMTELFGGFDSIFYSSYRETAGIDPSYSDRRDLYNLYHLLNHLNLFGGSYLYPVKSILQRYI